MAEKDCSNQQEKESPCPAVPMYHPASVSGLKEGEVKKWCTCGLSKTQPWCDSAHKGTGMHSLRWTVPATQTLYEICQCKHTKNPPYCDGTHKDLPCIVNERQAACPKKDAHTTACKLCIKCGWATDF